MFCALSANMSLCLSTAGSDVEKIVDVLEEVEDWEGLAGRLNFDTIPIKTNCDTTIWQARCYRRRLVRTYCDLLLSGDPRKAVTKFATILDQMKKKRQAEKLRELTFSSKLWHHHTVNMCGRGTVYLPCQRIFITCLKSI